MKSLIDIFFKREPALNYIISEYRPGANYIPSALSKLDATELDDSEVKGLEFKDEMQIDNLYQKN